MNDLHCRCLPLWACQIFAHRDILKSMEYNMKVAFCFYHWYFRKMSINVFTTLGLFLFMLRTFWQMSLFLSLHVVRPFPQNRIYNECNNVKLNLKQFLVISTSSWQFISWNLYLQNNPTTKFSYV